LAATRHGGETLAFIVTPFRRIQKPNATNDVKHIKDNAKHTFYFNSKYNLFKEDIKKVIDSLNIIVWHI
jgi:hypothetical protein